MVWNTVADDRQWSTSTLKELLNNYYYNSADASNTQYCYGWSSTVSSNCNYLETGINNLYRPMIKNVIWYLGGYSTSAATAEWFFNIEHSGEFLPEENDKFTSGYIGLMYVSDYGFSAFDDSCKKTIGLSSFGNSPCSENNWLYKNGYEWTITQYTDTSSYASRIRVMIIDTNGSISSGILNYGSSTRPVLYLDSSVYILDGDGSITNPYIIGM